jgi:hypothetical protein
MFESHRQRARRLAFERDRLREALTAEELASTAARFALKNTAAANNTLCRILAQTITDGRALPADHPARIVADQLADAAEAAGIDLSVELSWLAKTSTGSGRPILVVDGGSYAPLSLVRRLRLSERARASLDAQVLVLQQANEAAYRTGDRQEA